MVRIRNTQVIDNLKVEIPRVPLIDRPDTAFMTFGSCFALFFDQLISKYGFSTYFNHAITYHFSPESLADALEFVAGLREHGPDDLYRYADAMGGVRPYQQHYQTRFFGPEAETLALEDVKAQEAECRERIARSDVLVVTLGTVRVVRLLRNGRPITRAAKIPFSEFRSHRNTASETRVHLERMLGAVRAIRGSDLPHMVFTVSPQRYNFTEVLPGCEGISTFVDNNRCKATLLVALHEFLDDHRDLPLHYFPAFEIVQDELRMHENISTTDHFHVRDKYTPEYVFSRFMGAYGTAPVIAQINLLDRVEIFASEYHSFMRQGMPADNPHWLAKTDGLIAAAFEAAEGGEWNRLLAEYLLALLCIQGRAGARPDVLRAYLGPLAGAAVYIWGASGQYRDEVRPFLELVGDNIRVLGFVDNDPAKHGATLDGLPVHAPEMLAERKCDAVVLASAFHDQIRRQLAELAPGLPLSSRLSFPRCLAAWGHDHKALSRG